MDAKPPRRSRRPQNKRSKQSTFPLLPFLIGVIVLGFVIGAGFSMMGRRGASSDDVANVATAAPTDTPTFAPATLAPLATPRPIPSTTDDPGDDASDAPDSATPETASPEAPTAAASVALATSPKPRPSRTPAPHVALASLPTTAQAATPIPSAPPTKSNLIPSPVTPVPIHPHAVAARTASPAIAETAEPSQATATPARAVALAPAAVDADSDFGRLSASVVREYLRALGRGDTDSAYGAFGVSPGSSGVAFPEQPVMQSSAKILSIQSRGNNDAQYVTVDIGAPNGTYYATFGVRHNASGAAVIVTHSISKQ